MLDVFFFLEMVQFYKQIIYRENCHYNNYISLDLFIMLPVLKHSWNYCSINDLQHMIFHQFCQNEHSQINKTYLIHSVTNFPNMPSSFLPWEKWYWSRTSENHWKLHAFYGTFLVSSTCHDVDNVYKECRWEHRRLRSKNFSILKSGVKFCF